MLPDISVLLSESAARQPRALAIVDGSREVSFAELEALCARLARGLQRAGIGPGTRAALMVPPSVEFVALSFALMRAGAVPVLIDPGIGRAALKSCLAEAAPEAFIGIPKAQVARLAEGWAKATLKTIVTVGPRLFWGGLSLLELERLGAPAGELAPAPDETAAVLFTSGSTGSPKGAVYTRGIFHEQVRLLREHFEVRGGEVSVPTFPLFALFDVGLGMTAVLPRMDYTRPGSVDPERVIGPIQSRGASQLFGSPALLDAVSRYGERHGIFLPSLRRVISAGAPVPAKVIARLSRMLPKGAVVHTPYGATEALPVACAESSEILGETAALAAVGRGTCVGRSLPGVTARVMRVVDEPVADWREELAVPDGEVGEIVVRGPVVTAGYFRRPEADALSKLRGPGGEVWHRMGDLGYRDALGRLWFCGRKSHRVRAAGGDLYTIPCEGVFNAVPGVRRTALVGVGGRPVLCVELEPGVEASPALEDALRARGAAFPHTRAIEAFLFHPSFPVDIRHNAKIFREKLAVWAAERLS